MSLNTELQNKLLSEISKYTPLIEETDASILQIDEILEEHDADVEKNIIQQLSTLHNPFFMKAMEDYMPCELYRNDTVDAHIPNIQNIQYPKMEQNQMYDLYKR
jgi:hypothetical protein